MFYEGRLIDTPTITKTVPDDFWGIEEISDITMRFSNHDGYFSTKMASEELRNVFVTLQRWDENETGGGRLKFETAGRISSYNITDVAEITISSSLKEKLQQDYPRKVYEMSDWAENRPHIFNPPDDLGKPYSLCFGRCERVPCRYVHCDYTNNRYDYIIGYGILHSCRTVYRGELKVPATEYTFYDGSQASPYPGFAFLRFSREQRSFSGSLYTIYADVYGMKMGGTQEVRNFATIISNFLSDPTWGLGEIVNSSSVVTAETIFNSLGDFYCDGHISEQRAARDILNDLLFAARSRLKMNIDGEWVMKVDHIDNDIRATFGSGDGTYENIKSINRLGKTPLDSCVKTVTVHYKKDEWKNEYAFKYKRTAFPFGEDIEHSLPFVRDHKTADIINCYLQQRAIRRDLKATIEVGMDARFLNEGELVTLRVPRLKIDGTFRIQSIEKRASNYSLDLVSHHNDIYVYTAGALNTDAITQEAQPGAGAKDFKNVDAPHYEKPLTPTDIVFVSWSFEIAPGGAVTARLIAEARKNVNDDANFACIMFGARITGTASEFKWTTASEYESATGKWRASLDFPASGLVTSGGGFIGGGGVTQQFDLRVVAANVFGRTSNPVSYNSQNIPYKNIAVGSTPAVPAKITGGITIYNMFKTIIIYWNKSVTQDVMDYRIQIDDNSDFSSPIINMVSETNNFSFTTTAAYGTTLYVRVRPRNTSYIEADANDGTGNWVSTSLIVSETINIPNGSITGNMIHANIAGAGLSRDANNNLDVNVDNSTIEIVSDTLRVKNGGIVEAKIGSGAVTMDKIGSGAVTEAKIGSGAVTADKIGAGAVTEGKIGSGAVTEAKIGSGAVTEGKIGAGAVTEGKIGSGAVTTAKIGDDQVTEAKIRFNTTSGTAGTSSATLPANPEGFIEIDVGGSTKKVPYYPVA